jgi:1-acyl-sn-glycerol-3-phosphate acyltransferase
MIHKGLADGEWAQGRFEPIALDAPLSWKYRGQVIPRNERVTTLIELTKIEEDERGRVAVADGSLWVDGLRIYEAKGLAMRIVRDGAPPPADRDDADATAPARPDDAREPGSARSGVGATEERLDPRTATWLGDHRPTWTVPALPLMSMVDRLAAAAAREGGGRRVIAIEDARAHRWLPVPAPLRLRTDVEGSGDQREATLLAWREAANPALSRFEPVASARVTLAASFPDPDEAPWAPPADARPVANPYESGALFHGPSFQLLRSLAIGPTGSSAILDAGAGGAARGLLHEVLLDALTHGIPHDALWQWDPAIDRDQVAYPHRLASMRLFDEPPRAGEVRVEARFAGFDGDPRFPRVRVQAIAAGRVFAALELVEVLFPKGPLGALEPGPRRAFLRDRAYVEGARLSRVEGGATVLAEAEVRASDWLPGTVAGAYATEGDDVLAEVAAKEHVAARAQVHPSRVRVDLQSGLARSAAEPLTERAFAIERRPDAVAVREARPPRLDLAPVREFWDRYFDIGRWPVEDLYYGLAERFVRRVWIEDPPAHEAIRGRAVLYLGNHQVGIESLVFAILASGLSGVATVTLAKAEHRTTWLGNLIRHAFSYPGAKDPGVITYFERQDPTQLPRVIAELGAELAAGTKSVMVHVEGTRSLTCRKPVIKMSGAFLDMAIATNAPVVPVRFVGGLPVEPLEKRIEYPIGMGQQDILLGRPLLPEQLAALPYKERKELVIGAINALGPSNAEEAPIGGDRELAAAAEAWVQRTGASHDHATLLETMRRLPAPGEEMRQILVGAEAGELRLADDARGAWMAELARRMFGERGPRIVIG